MLRDVEQDVLSGKRAVLLCGHEVHMPSELWFRLDDDDDELDNLDHFYKVPEFDKEYIMHHSDALVGRAYAARIMEKWHRAEVVAAYDAKTRTAQVFSIDYGTTVDVSIGDLRHLQSAFAGLPRQAHCLPM